MAESQAHLRNCRSRQNTTNFTLEPKRSRRCCAQTGSSTKKSERIANHHQEDLMSLSPEIASARKPETEISRVWMFKMLRLGFIVSVGSVAATFVWKNYTQVESRQAFVNAEIIDVRNPIAGNLMLDSLQPGQWLTAGKAIGRVENLRQVAELEIKQQELKSRLQVTQQKQQGIQQQIRDRRRQLAQFASEVAAQKQLDGMFAQQQVEAAQSELDRVTVAAQTAKVDRDRAQELLEAGIVPPATAEKDFLRYEQAQAEEKKAQALLAQAQQRLRAAQAGLQIDGSRTLSYSEIRQREINTEIADLQRQAAQMRVEARTTELELAKLIQQTRLNKVVVISAPTTGAVWSVDAKGGEYLASSTPVLRVLNCQNRWVDAFFSEDSTKNLTPGMAVQVRLVGGGDRFIPGKIESLRSGSGRVATGYDVAVPPPESTQKQVAVRINLDWSAAPNAVNFCDVGRSAEVRFPKRLTL
ncbi:HlyD family secretion protein [Scytonema millei]|uniref:HlyD family efflux transporter periplasmic adaptor subunit n=1 Tax=Scytonema millei VB511283 TaxID=1245923 RepID=A0A9X5I6V3_9CYAN|nr:HlyD family efflux transporter periplasmic adaptor subunit [Scytonema millei]NHC37501.1 HlyD family efflux transporter periplasmic adaptor subunit [Scytonema millei VB511283]